LKTAILISSCPKNLALARWTAGVIDRLWAGHPPVYLSGSDAVGDLVMRSDPRDWMALTLDAASDLRGMGYSHLYLILDDHPPMGRCNAGFLNCGLPAAAERLGAAYVGLLGYGQHRERIGTTLGAGDLFLQRLPRDYRWRFSLHPALWSIAALETVLSVRMDQYPVDGHTPWNFERHRDERDVPSRLPENIAEGVYRICGARFDAAPGRLGRSLMQTALHCFFDGALFLTRLLKGAAVREEMSVRWLWAYSYYRGPYPLFWGGVMMQGKLSRHLGKFLSCQCPGEVRGVIGDAANYFGT